MSDCVNLRERYGAKYRVEYEESYHAERGDHARFEDPWLMILLCQHGHISPFGGEILVACTNHSGRIPTRLMTGVPSAEMWMDGDDGANIKFHVRDFETVALIMKPRRRRRLSAEQRERLVKVGKAHRFSCNSDGAPLDSSERRRTERGQDGLRAVSGAETHS